MEKMSPFYQFLLLKSLNLSVKSKFWREMKSYGKYGIMTVNQRVSRSSREGGATTTKGFKQLEPFFILALLHYLHTFYYFLI